MTSGNQIRDFIKVEEVVEHLVNALQKKIYLLVIH